VGENDQRITAVTGVVGAEAGRRCSSVMTANRGGQRSFKGGRRCFGG
jgi:hypothetical protein